jgi:hypothetical protein
VLSRASLNEYSGYGGAAHGRQLRSGHATASRSGCNRKATTQAHYTGDDESHNYVGVNLLELLVVLLAFAQF